MSMATRKSTASARISDRAAAYAMPGRTVDGNDFKQIAGAAFEAVEHARAGHGPSLIESVTYRWRGHSKSDRNRYRTREEIERWKTEHDPIQLFEQDLTAHGLLDDGEVEGIRNEVAEEIDRALDYARNGTPPDTAELTRYVYTTRDRAEYG
jgi:pyruvate dehydrogenase E1 component alpha subunit